VSVAIGGVGGRVMITKRLTKKVAAMPVYDLQARAPAQSAETDLVCELELTVVLFVAKLRSARQRKKSRTGTCEGAKPFGFYEGEIVVLDRMRQLRVEGLGYDSIAARLNEEGVSTRRTCSL